MNENNNYNKLFECFSEMDIDGKRNVVSEEIIRISYILKTCLNKYNENLIDEPYNYRQGIDKELDESEMLNKYFKDLFYIKKELLNLLELIDKRGLK